jgi:cytochrome c oxidase subunit 1
VAARPEQALPSWRDGTVVRRLLSIDHKSVGVLYLLVAGLFLVGAGLTRLLFFLDLAHVPGGLLSPFGSSQTFTLQATFLIFGSALAATLGLATYLVPLQIGARGIAWPRLNACAFWLYLIGISMMLVAFASGDPGPKSDAAPLSPQGLHLWLRGLLVIGIAAAVSAAALVETVRSHRAGGMTWARLPVFTKASVGFAGVLAVGMTISSIAAAVFLIDDGSARSFFVYDAGPGYAFYQRPAWFVGHVVPYAFFVPVIGMVTEALAIFGRGARNLRSLAGAAVYSTAAVGVLVGLYHLLADPFGDSFARGFPLAGFVLLGGLAPAVLAWLPSLRPGKQPPEPMQLLALGMIALLVVGTVLGFALGFPGDYKADSTTLHLIAHFDGTLAGAGLLGLAVGVLYWFPKLTGRAFDERLARAAAGLLVLGTLCVCIGEHIAGEGDLASFSSAAKTGTTLALAGYLLTFLGGAQFLGGALLSWRAGIRVGNDPRMGDTLEWFTTSPPPPHNFDRVPPVSSDRPLHDLRVRLEEPRRL